jgi:hypothetical protein
MKNLICQAYSLCNLYFWKYFSNFSSKTDRLATVFRKFLEKLENKQCTLSFLPGSDQFLLCLDRKLYEPTVSRPLKYVNVSEISETLVRGVFSTQWKTTKTRLLILNWGFALDRANAETPLVRKREGILKKGKQGQCEFGYVFVVFWWLFLNVLEKLHDYHTFLLCSISSVHIILYLLIMSVMLTLFNQLNLLMTNMEHMYRFRN